MGTPRGIRNNNPGNIRNSDATDWKGEVPTMAKRDNTFEEFTDMAHGYRALIKLLQNYRYKHGCKTIADFINRWAPRSENNTSAILHVFAKKWKFLRRLFRMWPIKVRCAPLPLR